MCRIKTFKLTTNCCKQNHLKPHCVTISKQRTKLFTVYFIIAFPQIKSSHCKEVKTLKLKPINTYFLLLCRDIRGTFLRCFSCDSITVSVQIWQGRDVHFTHAERGKSSSVPVKYLKVSECFNEKAKHGPLVCFSKYTAMQSFRLRPEIFAVLSGSPSLCFLLCEGTLCCITLIITQVRQALCHTVPLIKVMCSN